MEEKFAVKTGKTRSETENLNSMRIKKNWRVLRKNKISVFCGYDFLKIASMSMLCCFLSVLPGEIIASDDISIEKNYIYRGDLEMTKYYKGHGRPQKYWLFLPLQDLSGFSIVRDEEAAGGQSVLCVNYSQAPKVPEGWKNLSCAIDFTGIPEQKTEISFKARGEGFISAMVWEEVVSYMKSSKKRIGAKFPKTALTKEWQTFKFEYNPSENKELGLVKLLIYFHPDKDEKVNAYLDDVKAMAPAENRNARTGIPELTIPYLNRKPIIDGVFSPHEWEGAVPLSGFTQYYLSSPPSHGRSTAWIGYDDEALYVAFQADDGNAPVAVERKRDTGTWDDDSLEILLASPDDFSQRAHFIVSAANSIFDHNWKDKSPNAWNPSWSHAVGSFDTGWRVEVAIPWKELAWKVAPGQDLRFNLGHNNVLEEGSKFKEISSWGLALLPGEGTGFHFVKAYPLAHLGKSDVTAGAVLEYGLKDRRPHLELKIRNPKPEPAVLLCTYGTDSIIAGRMPVTVQADSTASIPVSTWLDGEYQNHVIVTLNEGPRCIYSHKEVFQQSAGTATDITLKKYFPINLVEITVDLKSVSTYTVKWKATNENDREIASQTISLKEPSRQNIKIPISEWERGKPYKLSVAIQDASGTELANKVFTIIRPPREPWEGNKAGISDKPIPPYTAINITGSTIECLMKKYEYGSHVLPINVESEGKKLLSKPVQITMKMEDSEHDLAAIPLEFSVKKANRVEWGAKSKYNGVDVKWDCWMEEDGFSWYQLKLTAERPVNIDELTLVIPLKKEFAKLINAMPFATSEGGDMEGQYLLRPQGWRSIDFKWILSVMNGERGIEISTEDNRCWSNKVKAQGQSIVFRDDHAEIRYAFIDKKTILDGEKTFAFGIQAFPAKPAGNDISSRKIAIGFETNDRRSSVFSSVASQGAFLKYPGKENIDPRHGTLEIMVYAGFDPVFQRTFPSISLAQQLATFEMGGHTSSLVWDVQKNGWTYFIEGRPAKSSLTGTKLPDWQSPGWHHVALTWGKNRKLYCDGVLLAETDARGLFDDLPVAKDINLLLGKTRGLYLSEFYISAIRISSEALTTESMNLDGRFTKTDATLLLQDFSKSMTGKTLQAPEYGTSGVLYGNAVLENFKDKTVLAFSPLPDRTRLDVLPELGVKAVVQQFYYSRARTPYFETEAEARVERLLIDECHKRGLAIFPSFSYGIGSTSREDMLYGDYWYTIPFHICGNIGDPRAVTLNCAGCKFYTDYMLYYWQKFFDEFDVDGLYTDNTFISGTRCSNIYHGCGIKNSDGTIHTSNNILAGREFMKRLYAICKLRKKPLHHDMHAGWCNHAIYASWADSYLCGEQYRAHRREKGWNIDLAQFRSQNLTRQYGVRSSTIPALMPYDYEQMIALVLLHDVDMRPIIWRWPTVNLMTSIWKLLERFDTEKAEWHPYWCNDALITTAQSKREFASLWLHKDKRALIVVSNLKWEKANVDVSINLPAMGLKGECRDALNGENVTLNNGKVSLPLGIYGMKILWVE